MNSRNYMMGFNNKNKMLDLILGNVRIYLWDSALSRLLAVIKKIHIKKQAIKKIRSMEWVVVYIIYIFS